MMPTIAINRDKQLSPRLDAAALKGDVDFFWRHGYLIVRNAFSAHEMQLAKQAIETNVVNQEYLDKIIKKTADGKHPAFETLAVWNDTSGDDIFAKLTRNYKIFDRLEAIFEDRVYAYHNKVAMKYPGTPGFSYHQDYFYWYSMGNLFPDMATASIAVDPSTRENGCLRVLDGSHKMGRIDHEYDNELEDSGVDKERLPAIKERCKEVFVELAIGDLVIFHCNTLHGSDDNTSSFSRLALLGCYNTRHNDPYKTTVHGCPFFVEQRVVTEPISQDDLHRIPNFAMKFTSK